MWTTTRIWSVSVAVAHLARSSFSLSNLTGARGSNKPHPYPHPHPHPHPSSISSVPALLLRGWPRSGTGRVGGWMPRTPQDALRPTARKSLPRLVSFFSPSLWVWIWSGSNWITSVADAFESASASVSVGGGARAGMVCVMGHQQA
ncbi:hypothetical protein BKA56DRAFT_101799 [Ilyonectria sp. MPI-CAGE-AT-0026]|nr:hypothetical protein BKA56DRAFT_101799 [Ilyonectria sp. MPI-CAGE-AT-0026]